MLLVSGDATGEQHT